MKIAGIQKLTLLDFPGHTACTLFLAGCNMRCGYCHNQELVVPECIKNIADSFISESALFNFLDQRKGLLDGVCITGGEPTMHSDLPELINRISNAGFKVKLDTNGTNFRMVESLINNNKLDYIAMDIKASPENYIELTKVPKILLKNIQKTKDLIMTSGIDYEFRTTVVKETHPPEEIKKLTETIKGAKRFFIQNFQKNGGCIDQKFDYYTSLTNNELEELKSIALKQTQHCGIRQ